MLKDLLNERIPEWRVHDKIDVWDQVGSVDGSRVEEDTKVTSPSPLESSSICSSRKGYREGEKIGQQLRSEWGIPGPTDPVYWGSSPLTHHGDAQAQVGGSSALLADWQAGGPGAGDSGSHHTGLPGHRQVVGDSQANFLSRELILMGLNLTLRNPRDLNFWPGISS